MSTDTGWGEKKVGLADMYGTVTEAGFSPADVEAVEQANGS